MDAALCPCGSQKSYASCCQPIISGKKPAATAEALMRSRYSAYVKHEIDFIVSSCAPPTDEDSIDPEETRRWSEESEWLGLKIHRTEKGGESDSEGLVEFSATYARKGLRDEHREIASFKKIGGKWVYSEGKMVATTIIRSAPKQGRNESCACGSGKKFKQCCGK